MCRGFRLSVEFVDLGARAFLDYSAAQLHRGREGTIVGVEFLRNQQNPFQLFESCEILVYLFHNSLVEREDLWMGDKFGARRESYVVGAGPVFEEREVGRHQDKGELALVAQDDGHTDEWVELQRVFDGLRGDKFSA